MDAGVDAEEDEEDGDGKETEDDDEVGGTAGFGGGVVCGWEGGGWWDVHCCCSNCENCGCGDMREYDLEIEQQAGQRSRKQQKARSIRPANRSKIERSCSRDTGSRDGRDELMR